MFPEIKSKQVNQQKQIRQDELSKNIQVLLKERTERKKVKDFKQSDKIRTQLSKMGYTIEDTKRGQRIYLLK